MNTEVDTMQQQLSHELINNFSSMTLEDKKLSMDSKFTTSQWNDVKENELKEVSYIFDSNQGKENFIKPIRQKSNSTNGSSLRQEKSQREDDFSNQNHPPKWYFKIDNFNCDPIDSYSTTFEEIPQRFIQLYKSYPPGSDMNDLFSKYLGIDQNIDNDQDWLMIDKNDRMEE